VNMTELLIEAAAIIAGYSEGTLPTPHYITVNSDHNSIGFLMASSGEVERWGFATDSTMRRAEVGKNVHWTIMFDHGSGDETVHVSIFHVQHPALVESDA
jgi:hypothetical protein